MIHTHITHICPLGRYSESAQFSMDNEGNETEDNQTQTLYYRNEFVYSLTLRIMTKKKTFPKTIKVYIVSSRVYEKLENYIV